MLRQKQGKIMIQFKKMIVVVLIGSLSIGFGLIAATTGPIILYNLINASLVSALPTIIEIGGVVTVAAVMLLGVVGILNAGIDSTCRSILSVESINRVFGSGGLIGTIIGSVGTVYQSFASGSIFGSAISSNSEMGIAIGAVALPLLYAFSEIMVSSSSVSTLNSNVESPSASNQTSRPGVNQGSQVVRDNNETNASPSSADKQTFESSNDLDDLPSPNRRDNNSSDNRGSNRPSNESPEQPSEYTFDWQSNTSVSFDDVGGMDKEKQRLKERVMLPLTEHQDEAEKLGISVQNVILYGPPGTGKTYIAEALASELDLPFAMLSGGNIQSKWVNESANKVNTLFNEAKRLARRHGGAVIFIDELDSVLGSRNDHSTHQEDKKVVNEFLNQLEKCRKHNIVFIGATNRIESLDEAGIRSGRIDEKIHIGKPDKETRKEVLNAQLEKRSNTVSDACINKLADQTDGLVPADLATIVEDAARNALTDGRSKINDTDLESALMNMSD